ncbi:antibiotic biosynthesis monooxygenase [Enterococcus plantarum]|uniref:Antibiotic biosynthesis monooxygenase n=1 Tax=Enterococcus plantarum TaxID=1077675 RepID=A0A2W3YVR6_9ENTE|nr:antibiotic biosynthesis monooxygenase [Enterococcus plantarum]MBO0422084.1 antibiotic biosynthesis monooxygenase [Enterococcus plantarum]OEG15368.1 antibiotic biosynthesis monooxygenase [Enterococcus plantarum]PZL71988.1 antibiotic biosynthesis monooxygenase [Enterococcus plantarum]
MIVQTVTFIIKKEGKERFDAKTGKDVASMLEFPGCISSECWYTENKDTCEFMLVSKWQSKKDFQNWLKRPEHLQEHREAHQNKEATPSIVIEKIRKSYEVSA